MLRSRFVLPVVVLTLAISLDPATAVGEEARLLDLVESTLETHEDMTRAESRVRRAGADVKLASSALMPRMDLSGSWVRYDEEISLELAPGETFVLTPLTDWTWSANVRQTLFYGLRDWRGREFAKENQASALVDERTIASDLVLRVSQAFFDALAAKERVDVQRARLEAVEAQLGVAKRRFEVGETARADVARWESEVAGSVQALVVAEGDAEFSRRALERLTQVSDITAFVAPESIPAPDGDREELLAAAVENRPELESLERQKNASDLWIKIEKGAWLPELEAIGQYFQQKALFPSQDWLSLTLSLKVPIYDGGLTSARVARAKEDLVELQALEQQVMRGVRDQVDGAAIAHAAAVAAFAAAELRQVSSREAFRQVERAYRVGESSATDLLVATTDVTDSEVVYIIARWQQELQAIALRHALGLSPLPGLDLATYIQKQEGQ